MVSFSGGMVTAYASDLITSAGYEIGVFAPGEPVSSPESLFALEKLQRLIDQWNARQEMIFSIAFEAYVLTGAAPETIGPSGTFNTGPAANYRPVKIGAASFVLSPGSGNPVDLPIQIRDKDWWAANPLKSMRSSIITDLYYDPAGLNGSLNFFPIASAGGTVRLELWNSLQQALTLQTELGLVQGYWDALVLTLAVSMIPAFEIPPNPVLLERQRQAVKVITENNTAAPRIDTQSGMPGAAGTGRPDFNFLTGMRE